MGRDFLENQLYQAALAVKGFEIPSPESSDIDVVRTLIENKASISEIQQEIEKNLTLVRELLYYVNNSKIIKGNGIKVKSVLDAINAVGVDSLNTVFMSHNFELSFRNAGVSERILKDSIQIGVLSKALAIEAGFANSDDVYICGLFSNSGALMYSLKYGEYYDSFYERSLMFPYSSLVNEANNLGCGHNYVGASVTSKWKIHDDIVKVVMLSHYRQIASIEDSWMKRATIVVQLATAMVAEHSLKKHVSQEVSDIYSRAKDILGFNEFFINECLLGLKEVS